ncbi:enoyl-CoA hydratase/isomerase family protein [Pseudaestuariivita atlantica]|uniref:3-hydroxyisobutyryl-CoA hydrolase n=1 Tax=Pseudaestuariivita atlantica TaxID=1317121 RepID=A0A0L1JV00_9RHOB|nr:enoyl-CoA hydratase/isomerase family protein [Pseudaestuariivita atlantica]KNG95596.1 enoyl-CoA hydratase [Pseudaestuariivita atlantica]
MSDIHIRIDGRAGRITLNRPKALNALTYQMCLDIEAALDAWRDDDAVALVLLEAEGDKAFCAGGDIAEMYATGTAGDYEYGRQFWRDEYRLNAKIFEYPKPVVSFLQGFTMGGGVGVGCHGTHRIVGESSKIAMPECGIGLVPDVGGSLMLALAPGRLGEYLGTTAHRMGPADAILAGFADHFVPEEQWEAAKEALLTGTLDDLEARATTPPPGTLADLQPRIDAHFAGETLADIHRALRASDDTFAQEALDKLARNAPLAMACAVEIVHRVRGATSIRDALDQEYRYTHRAMQQGDFLEGIRAAIIDRDRQPKWAHAGIEDVRDIEVAQMLLPLGKDALTWEDRT